MSRFIIAGGNCTAFGCRTMPIITCNLHLSRVVLEYYLAKSHMPVGFFSYGPPSPRGVHGNYSSLGQSAIALRLC